MRRALLLGAVLATIGCGGAGGDQPSIAGSWIASINSSCDAFLDLTQTDFALGDVCVDANGTTVDLSETKGTYTYDGTTWITTNESATCAGTALHFGAPLSRSGQTLTMSSDTGAIVFSRNTAAASGVVTYGCFSNGTFTPGPLTPL